MFIISHKLYKRIQFVYLSYHANCINVYSFIQFYTAPPQALVAPPRAIKSSLSGILYTVLYSFKQKSFEALFKLYKWLSFDFIRDRAVKPSAKGALPLNPKNQKLSPPGRSLTGWNNRMQKFIPSICERLYLLRKSPPASMPY